MCSGSTHCIDMLLCICLCSVTWNLSLVGFVLTVDSQVEGFDLLAPYGGELCGGSLREDNYHALKERMERLGITEKFAW